jgi:hypothetical protein
MDIFIIVATLLRRYEFGRLDSTKVRVVYPAFGLRMPYHLTPTASYSGGIFSDGNALRGICQTQIG